MGRVQVPLTLDHLLATIRPRIDSRRGAMAPESSCCPPDGARRLVLMVRREPLSRPSKGEWATPSLLAMSLVPRIRGLRPLRLRDGFHGPLDSTPSRRRRGMTRRSGGKNKNSVIRRGSFRLSERHRRSSSSSRCRSSTAAVTAARGAAAGEATAGGVGASSARAGGASAS